MGLSRKEQIFAKTKSVGGKRKAIVDPKPASGIKHILETKFSKGEVVPTIIKSVSYKLGDKIHTIENANVKSIQKDKKKPIAFIVQGKEKIDNEENVLSGLPKDLFNNLNKENKKEEDKEVNESEKEGETINKE
ncbi:hypothetical protein EHP00_1246 [Ecytonucleospora hepatopenaei]|uniref:Uncharacterized protein n=1 Tax=Ecytonucleospora hepatopenaei TaxID=646526 RepID=A0A1W0E3F5_9MICR|nr:hypothetical protein EHP00_1246 [Ecytonucleospora hepatopenaei]